MLARKRRRPKAVKTRGEGKSKRKNKSWMPGQKGQGGEGLSHGYGGSAGDGKGASGPEKQPKMRDERRSDAVADEAHRNQDVSPALPSRERIAKVLR
jgi:hypothetical protein